MKGATSLRRDGRSGGLVFSSTVVTLFLPAFDPGEIRRSVASPQAAPVAPLMPYSAASVASNL
jgi:hypothetical protein